MAQTALGPRKFVRDMGHLGLIMMPGWEANGDNLENFFLDLDNNGFLSVLLESPWWGNSNEY